MSDAPKLSEIEAEQARLKAETESLRVQLVNKYGNDEAEADSVDLFSTKYGERTWEAVSDPSLLVGSNSDSIR